MEALYNNYKDRAAIYIVYIREAHPSDERRADSNQEQEVVFRPHFDLIALLAALCNKKQDVVFRQPATFWERAGIAHVCMTRLELSLPCLIDGMDDTVDRDYSASPDRIYIVDMAGKIVFKGQPGPRGFDVEEAEEALKQLLDG